MNPTDDPFEVVVEVSNNNFRPAEAEVELEQSVRYDGDDELSDGSLVIDLSAMSGREKDGEEQREEKDDVQDAAVGEKEIAGSGDSYAGEPLKPKAVHSVSQQMKRPDSPYPKERDRSAVLARAKCEREQTAHRVESIRDLLPFLARNAKRPDVLEAASSYIIFVNKKLSDDEEDDKSAA